MPKPLPYPLFFPQFFDFPVLETVGIICNAVVSGDKKDDDRERQVLSAPWCWIRKKRISAGKRKESEMIGIETLAAEEEFSGAARNLFVYSGAT